MSKIAILPDRVANKIAAGEVVQRPESVIKELMENAIDAESSKVEVFVQRAGKALLRVIDDGEGMTEEDAILCVQKHATSKISNAEDLEALTTLGFRGEALSSIAAVSRLEIRTERNADELGTLVRVEENGELTREKGSFPKGTSVSVKQLFYNTPARRNFLKTDSTELKHILDTFQRLSLSHPEIWFRLSIDGDLEYDYPSGQLSDRVRQVFGREVYDAVIPVKEETSYISVVGFAGKPSLIRKVRGDQYVFLNNRIVQSKQVNFAVFSAYEHILEKSDFPFFILFLKVDPKRVDVNVHPSKLEVRFDDDKGMFNFVQSVIKRTLAAHDLVPALVFNPSTGETEKFRIANGGSSSAYDFSDRPLSPVNPPSSNINSSRGLSGFENRIESRRNSDEEIDRIFQSLSGHVELPPDSQSLPLPFDAASIDASRSEPNTAFSAALNSGRSERITETDPRRSKEGAASPFIVQLHNKYILCQIKSGMMVIDQHVAHERILYERAKKALDNDLPLSQQLLFPVTVVLDSASFALAREIDCNLQKIGFTLNFTGKNVVEIEGVPQDVKTGEEQNVLLELLDEYIKNQRESQLEAKENTAKSYSCKAAIKAGDPLSDLEMRILIDHLFATSMPYVCPHGRPIVVKITLDEFDRRFGRTS